MRCGRAFIFFAVVGLSAAAAVPGRAAQILIEAPDACVDPATVAEEVSDLVGKPLAEVADIDFRVQISERQPHGWRLRLETVDPRRTGASAVLGTREIEGASCAELAEAASVAIAVSVRSIAGAASPSEPSPAPPPPAPPQPVPRVEAADHPPPRAELAPVKAPWRPALALALASDVGALPSADLGVDLEGSLQKRWFRLVAFATWFGSEDTVVAPNAGGTFQLLLGGALGCWASRMGRFTPLACGGVELGRLAGTGLDIAHPETGVAFWRAARADLGTEVALGGSAAFLLRAGIAVPWTRPDFVLDGSQLVYRPSRLSGRLTAGIALGF